MKECWINVYDGSMIFHKTKELAIFHASIDILYRIHVKMKG